MSMFAGSIAVGLEIGGMQAFISGWGGMVALVANSAKKMVGSLVAISDSVAAAGDNIQKMSKRIYMSTEFLSEMDFVLQQNGASIGDFELATKGMVRILDDAKDGLASATRTLEKMGLTVEDFQDLNPEEQFMLMAKSIRDIANDSDRGAVALEAFSRSGTKLLPTLESNLEGLREQARKTGATFDENAANLSADYVDAVNEAKWAWDGLYKVVAEGVMPHLRDTFRFVGKAIPRFAQWAKTNALVGDTFQWIRQTLTDMWNAWVLIQTPLTAFSKFWAKIWIDSIAGAVDEAVNFMIDVLESLGIMLDELGSSLVETGIPGVVAAGQQVEQLAGSILQANQTLKDTPILFSLAAGAAESLVNNTIDGFAEMTYTADEFIASVLTIPDAVAGKGGKGKGGKTTKKAVDEVSKSFQGFAKTGMRAFYGLASGASKSMSEMLKSLVKTIADMAFAEGIEHYFAGLAQSHATDPKMASHGHARMAAGIQLMALGAAGGLLSGGGDSGGGGGDSDSSGDFSGGSVTTDVDDEDKKGTTNIILQGDFWDSPETGSRMVEIINQNTDRNVKIHKDAIDER